jgi:hypothetical protein
MEGNGGIEENGEKNQVWSRPRFEPYPFRIKSETSSPDPTFSVWSFYYRILQRIHIYVHTHKIWSNMNHGCDCLNCHAGFFSFKWSNMIYLRIAYMWWNVLVDKRNSALTLNFMCNWKEENPECFTLILICFYLLLRFSWIDDTCCGFLIVTGHICTIKIIHLSWLLLFN